MNNPLYVIYDDNMNLVQITSIKPETSNFFITEKSKVRDFYSGVKSYPGHYVKKHGLTKFTIEEKHFGNIAFTYNDLIDIHIVNYKTDLQVFYNKVNSSWEFKLDSNIVIESLHQNNFIELYLIKKFQHNFLIRTFTMQIADLIKGPVVFKFTSKYEDCIENLLIKTKQHFDTIGLYV